MVREIGDCVQAMRDVTRRRPERIYLGPCGATMFSETDGCPVDCECHNGPQYACTEPGGCGSSGCGRATGQCDARLYGRLGTTWATCRTCGARHDIDQRIAERSELAGQYRYTAAEIADAYPALRANTITKWHGRGLLTNHGDEGRPLYDVAEVLKVADSADQRHRQAIERRVAQGAGMGA
jgi:hypothetical protein